MRTNESIWSRTYENPRIQTITFCRLFCPNLPDTTWPEVKQALSILTCLPFRRNAWALLPRIPHVLLIHQFPSGNELFEGKRLTIEHHHSVLSFKHCRRPCDIWRWMFTPSLTTSTALIQLAQFTATFTAGGFWFCFFLVTYLSSLKCLYLLVRITQTQTFQPIRARTQLRKDIFCKIWFGYKTTHQRTRPVSVFALRTHSFQYKADLLHGDVTRN